MPAYRITEKAGRFVAGRNNTGAGSVLFLTEKEAEYELSLGTLVADGGDAGGTIETAAPEEAGEGGGEGEGATTDLSQMTKAELVALAAEREIAINASASKAEILAALTAAQG